MDDDRELKESASLFFRNLELVIVVILSIVNNFKFEFGHCLFNKFKVYFWIVFRKSLSSYVGHF